MHSKGRRAKTAGSSKKTVASTSRTDTYTFTVLFEHDEDGYIVASVPILSGCATQGKTHEEATANIREAITAYLESLREDGEPIPKESAEGVIGRVQVKLPVPA